MNFTSTSHHWTTPDGQVFSYSTWAALTHPPRAVLIAVHGLSGAALDYEPLGRHLSPFGITTLAIELRGHGNDPVEKRRGDLATLEDWFSDLHAYIGLVRRENPRTPLFLYGESMGAAILTRFLAGAASEDQPAGLILASPVVAPPQVPSQGQMLLFRFFHWLRPTFRINVGKLAKRKRNAKPVYVTRDENHRKWFETAPHRLERYTIRFFWCLYELIAGCFEAAPRLQLPVLVIYATNDVFIPPGKVEEFFVLIGSRDKELKLFPEAYHLLLHDDDRALALAAVEEWLLARLGGPKSASPDFSRT